MMVVKKFFVSEYNIRLNRMHTNWRKWNRCWVMMSLIVLSNQLFKSIWNMVIQLRLRWRAVAIDICVLLYSWYKHFVRIENIWMQLVDCLHLLWQIV